jgi:hypothetical protein
MIFFILQLIATVVATVLLIHLKRISEGLTIHNLPVLVLKVMFMIMVNIFSYYILISYLFIGFVLGMVVWLLYSVELPNKETIPFAQKLVSSVLVFLFWGQLVMLFTSLSYEDEL